MTVHSLRDRTLAVTPIRVALGLAALGAARLAGAPSTGSLLAFAGGIFVIVFMLFNDPRARFLRGAEPRPLPADAQVAPLWRQGLAASLPSTVGVSVLAAISLYPEPVLSALLGGVCAGLGAAGALSLTRIDPALYVDPKTGTVYRR